MTRSDDVSFFDEFDESGQTADAGAAPSGSGLQYLAFKVSGVELGVQLACVAEIVPCEAVIAVPGVPVYVRGIVHVRGQVIPVIDLACKLGLPPAAAAKRTSILLLDLVLVQERLPIGILMDGVASLLEVAAAQVRPPPRFGSGVAVEYLQGLLPTEHGMLPLVDFERVFARDELAQVTSGVSQL